MAADPLIERIVARVRTEFDATVDRSVARTFRDVPAYPASPEPSLRPDLRDHTVTVFEAVLNTMLEARHATRADFPITSEQASRRIRQGITLTDFLKGFRIGQESLWEAIVEASRPEQESRDAALDVAIHVMHVIEVGCAVAAEAYMGAQQDDLAEGDRVRRDVMEDLLAGRELTPGPKNDLAELSDLRATSRVLVAAAVPAKPLRSDQSLREALSSLRSVFGPRGIVVLRQDHMVGVTPVDDDGAGTLAALEKAHRGLTRRRIHLTIGLSTIHDGLSGVPEAYREAVLGRESLAGQSGVRALTAIAPLDYLVMIKDATAERLVRPALRTFIEEDLADGGTQIQTLQVYAECDLNAKIAAERLHVHVNTAYYRLDNIAERTGCDVRSFVDLQEMLIAIRLLAAPPSAADASP